MFYLEIVEEGERIPTGDRRGYRTLAEAKEAAKEKVDDAMPRNHVHILHLVGRAQLGGDGEPYVRDE